VLLLQLQCYYYNYSVTTTTTVSLLQHTTTVVLLHSKKRLKCVDVYEKTAGHWKSLSSYYSLEITMKPYTYSILSL